MEISNEGGNFSPPDDARHTANPSNLLPCYFEISGMYNTRELFQSILNPQY